MKSNIFFCNPPPHNILAEELFLGIVLLNLNYKVILELNNQVSVSALILESHRIIYKIILYQTYKSRTNLIQVIHYLSEKRLLHKIGGLGKILELINQALIFQNISAQPLILQDYITIIQDKYIRRLIVRWSTYIIMLGLSESIDLDLVFQQANKYIEKIFLLKKHNHTFSLSTTLKDLIDNFYLAHKQNSIFYSNGIKCGLIQLDKLTQGFQPSDLIILAGRPGMGKTSVALNIISYILKNAQHGVILFSFEMSKQQILYRLLSIQCQISVHRLRNGSISIIDLEKIKRNCQFLTKSFFYIDDNPNTTIFELYLKTKEIVEVHNTNLIIIDYLQLIQNSSSQFDNRVQELSSITRILKILARETSIPLIVLSQLNRNTEGRSNKRPLLSDLRESGCFWEKANVIWKYKQLKINQMITYFTYYIHSTQNEHLTSYDNVGKKFSHGLQYTYILELLDNTSLCMTSNHKLLTFAGWKTKDHLSCFETIAITRNCLYAQELYNKLLTINRYSCELAYDIKVNNLLNFHIEKAIIHNSIEQDADLVLLLYREDYYDHNNTSNNKLAEIIIAKHRNGPTGSFQLHFDALHTIFTNY
uniref:Replicative DNA helicase n=1 Tax=Hildenbrandia rubra TaxID=31481 RepID=A0A1C9CG62_9FLOR|nr:replication helicase subunit [Hildenbrandia rubra]AOM67373.1 replication helicase subunit [Hildenbrandia rubra]